MTLQIADGARELRSPSRPESVDVVVVGAGQAGLPARNLLPRRRLDTRRTRPGGQVRRPAYQDRPAATLAAAETTEQAMTGYSPDWREFGVRIVRHDRLDSSTAQTPGMHREAAVTRTSVGAEKIWAGTVTIQPGAKTGPHHHGALESVIYVLRGRARMRWGDQLEFVCEAGPGDFIYVPPHVPHQEINASDGEPLSCVVVRSDQEPVVVNLDLAAVPDPSLIES